MGEGRKGVGRGQGPPQALLRHAIDTWPDGGQLQRSNIEPVLLQLIASVCCYPTNKIFVGR